jgi:hypothetical protein
MFRSLPILNRTQKSPIFETYRSAEVYAAYSRQIKLSDSKGPEADCALCDEARVVVNEQGPVRVIQNDFPYAVYQGLPVKEHMMAVTARHVSDLADLTAEEAAVYWRVCAEYNKRSYTLFTQAATKSQRSIPGHIHTHMILCDDPVK